MLHGSDVLILPGLGGSGPSHWQTHWEREHGYRRVEQRDWDVPVLERWLETLDRSVDACERPCVMVAHSLACSLVAHYARTRPAAGTRVRAALLVSPADVEDPRCTPDVVRCFAPIPRERLPFRSCVIASRNDPYVPLARAEALARSWGAAFEDAGDAGHINPESGFGSWAWGHERLVALV